VAAKAATFKVLTHYMIIYEKTYLFSQKKINLKNLQKKNKKKINLKNLQKKKIKKNNLKN